MFFDYIMNRVKQVLANKFTLIGLTFCLLSSMTKPAAADDQHAFYKAIASDNIAYVRTLINADTDVNQQNPNGLTPLHMAATHGRTEIAQLLLAAGANINQKDSDDFTPLRSATSNKDPETTRFLLTEGARIIDKQTAKNIITKHSDLLPLAIAMDQAHHQKTFKALLSPKQWEELRPAIQHELNRFGIGIQGRRHFMQGIKPGSPFEHRVL